MEGQDGVYRVTVRLATSRGDKRITFALKLQEDMEESQLVFNPLLIRFLRGEDPDLPDGDESAKP